MTTHDSAPGDLPSFRLDGRLAVVTGASQGIGRTFAQAYARAGAELVFVGPKRGTAWRSAALDRELRRPGSHRLPRTSAQMDGIRSLERDVLKII